MNYRISCKEQHTLFVFSEKPRNEMKDKENSFQLSDDFILELLLNDLQEIYIDSKK